MAQEFGTWWVELRDGSQITQYGSNDPRAINGEFPFRYIPWSDVQVLGFRSDRANARFAIPAPPPGCRWSLRSRTYVSNSYDQIQCFLLCLSEVTDLGDVTPENTLYCLYWFADGADHHCPFLNSPEAAHYGTERAHDRRVPLNQVYPFETGIPPFMVQRV